MAGAFVFRKVLYLVEASGRRARNLDELLRLVTIADKHTIEYHMNREFLAYKFVFAEYPNDFAYWAARVLGDEILGERLANLRAWRYFSLADVQHALAATIADHMLRYPEVGSQRAPIGREFNLSSARKFVLRTGRTAEDLSEFASVIADVEASSLYFHLFETRFERQDQPNDFALWAADMGEPKLAERLATFDPYMFSIDQSRKVLLRILSEAQGRGMP